MKSNAAVNIIPVAAPQAVFETITPIMASEWLENYNTNNRNIKRAHVIRLARDMGSGKWVGANGEAIRFDADGRLVDGQHRLAACVMSGVDLESLVVRGVPVKCYDTIGIGAKKSVADFLAPNGYKNAVLVASTTKLVAMWQDGNLGELKNGDMFPTVSRVMETLENNPAILESVHFVVGNKDVKSLITPSFAALIHYVGTLSHNNAVAISFLERTGNGLGLLDTDPVYHLRKFLLSQKSSRRKAAQPYVLALIIKAWNLSKSEKKVQSLQFRIEEKFPVLA